MSFQVGDTIGDYQIEQVLGAGGMGKVYKVRNTISDRTEAMKVLLPNLEDNADLADRFLREVKIQAKLDHPNIAALHTAVRIGNQLLMLMEFVEGDTIEALMRQKRVTVQQGAAYLSQVLSALEFAHSRGVIHRDIKPANMMVTPHGVVKLMDFGIAKAADHKLTQTGHTVGSLFYMSPEQINGSAIDGRADLYSLGVSLYEIVTGKRPFDGDSDYSIMASHLLGTPAPPIEIDPRLPQQLNDVILISIAKDPSRRFQSAAAFRTALSNAMTASAQTAVLATPPSTPLHPQAVLPAPSAAPLRTAPFQAGPHQAGPVQTAQAPSSSGKRALYMVAGSVATLAVIGFAVVQGPQWFRAKAVTAQPVVVAPAPIPATTTVAAAPAPNQPPHVIADPVLGRPAVDQGPQQLRASQRHGYEIVQPRPVQRPLDEVKPYTREHIEQGPRELPPPDSRLSSALQEGYAKPSQPPVDRAKAAEMRELEQRWRQLGSRVRVVNSTMEGFQIQQAREGHAINAVFTSRRERMMSHFEDAQRFIHEGDAESAQRSLNLASQEIERLEEKFNIR